MCRELCTSTLLSVVKQPQLISFDGKDYMVLEKVLPLCTYLRPLLPCPFLYLPSIPPLSSPQDEVYKLHHLEGGPSREVELSRNDLLQFYREMNIIREMENSARTLYQEKKIRGFLHVYIGQVRASRSIIIRLSHDMPRSSSNRHMTCPQSSC